MALADGACRGSARGLGCATVYCPGAALGSHRIGPDTTRT